MSEDPYVLVVDDFSTMRRIVKKVLKEIGITRITEAENGANAWELLQKEPVDLVICDWNMPEMSGYELLQNVRADERLGKIPFIMVTAEGVGKSVLEEGQEKLTNYIAKPFKGDVLGEKIKMMLSD